MRNPLQLSTWRFGTASLSTLAFAALASFVPIVAAAQATPKQGTENIGEARARPNILMLVAEDMGPRLGAFGDDVAITPNLDALAARGVRYTNVFTTAGVCAPSRAALITGVHQNALGAGHMRSHGYAEAKYRAVPPAEIKAFPELLRARGYYTYTTVKLDYQFSGVMPGQGPESIWDAESARSRAVGWRDREEGQPFFGMLNYMETHESALFPRWVWPRSISHLVMMLVQGYTHWGEPSVVAPADVVVPPYYPDNEIVRGEIARHYDNIATLDRRVGEELAALAEEGLAETTIVIFTTDHGDGLPRAKRELFDSGTRVPLIIAWPDALRPAGATPGKIDPQLVSFIDLAPTVLHMAGAPIPAYMRGRVFVGDQASPERQYVFGAADRVDEMEDRRRSIRDARYRYIRNDPPQRPGARHSEFRDTLDSMRELWRAWEADELTGAQRIWFEPRPLEELYDTATDPHEITNLADEPEYAAELVRLRSALDRFGREVADLGAIPERELAERSWPAGEQPRTDAPTLRPVDGGTHIEIKSATPGASIEFRSNGGPWKLYFRPVERNETEVLEARAVRYGFELSETTRARRTDP